jgi:hypothetical protein
MKSRALVIIKLAFFQHMTKKQSLSALHVTNMCVCTESGNSEHPLEQWSWKRAAIPTRIVLTNRELCCVPIPLSCQDQKTVQRKQDRISCQDTCSSFFPTIHQGQQKNIYVHKNICKSYTNMFKGDRILYHTQAVSASSVLE